MLFSKNTVLSALLLCICLAGGIILLYRSDRLSPNYVILECKDGNKYRLQATDAQSLYDRSLYIKKRLEESWAEHKEAMVYPDWSMLHDPGELEVAIYDKTGRKLGAMRLCRYLPFTVFEPFAPLTSVKDCIGDDDRILFYQNQPEWNNEKNLIYEALDSKEVAIVRYLVGLGYHRNRNMDRLPPIWYAKRIRFDEGVHILESEELHNK